MSPHRAARPRTGAAGSVTRSIAVGLALALGASVQGRGADAQTVERHFDPAPTGTSSVIYPGETAHGALDVVDLLKWYAPGVQADRLDDGTVDVRIRGGCIQLMGGGPQNPLLIIDGLPVPDPDVPRELPRINVQEVDHIEVLRDIASTSIYGTKGACGVIRVFMRR